ncbi:MAG: hypothetical protein GW809_01830, partial [Bacteroidetes bacterium]|nr:hypothetical protein [Bacteroidota bacterium]
MNKEDVDITHCECIFKSAGQWCDSFHVLNKDVPEYSVNQIFQKAKLKELIDQKIYDPVDVPEDFTMTEIQRDKVTLQKLQTPMIDKDSIRKT